MKKRRIIALGVSLGIVFGSGVGLIFGNPGPGIGIGILLGAITASLLTRKQQTDN